MIFLSTLRRSVEATDRESSTSNLGLRIESQAWLARIVSDLGDFAEGRRHGEEALRLATRVGSANTPIIAHRDLGHLYLTQGDLAPAMQVLEHGLALCRTAGNRASFLPLAGDLGAVFALQGRLVEGRALLEEAVSAGVRTGGRQGQARRVAQLSEACRLARQGAEAVQHARQALDLAGSTRNAGTRRSRCISLASSRPTATAAWARCMLPPASASRPARSCRRRLRCTARWR